MLAVRENDPQWHLRELTHETGLEEREVHAEGADERGRPLPLEQFRDDNVGTWCRAHAVADPCVSWAAAALSSAPLGRSPPVSSARPDRVSFRSASRNVVIQPSSCT